MDEVGRDDAAGLRGKELLPGRAGAAWCGVDPGGMQDLPHRGCCDRMAELDEFALHRRCLHSPGNVDSLWPGGRRHGRCCGLLAGGRACALCWCRTSWRPACDARPAASCVTGKVPAQRPRGISCASTANHTRSAGSYRIRPPCRRSTVFSCRSASSSASLARSLRNAGTARPSIRRTSTRPANHHRVQAAGESAAQPDNRVFERHTIDLTVTLPRRAYAATR